MQLDTYKQIKSSLLSFCSDFKDQEVAKGYLLSVVNLDAFTDEKEWPEGDFIGISEVVIEIRETGEVSLAFVLSTLSDINHFRLDDMINDFVNQVYPGESIPLINLTTGVKEGNLIVQSGVQVGAPLPTKTQSLTPIMVTLLADR